MYEHDERQYVGENGREPPLDAARRPNAELEAADVDQHSLENTFVSAQMRPPHAPGVVERGEGAFDSLAALPHQAAPAAPAQAPTIAIDGRLGRRVLRPAVSPTVGLGDVGPNANRVEVHHRLIAVIALVADDLFELSPASRRTILRMAAFPSKVVASMAVVRPFNKPAATSL